MRSVVAPPFSVVAIVGVVKPKPKGPADGPFHAASLYDVSFHAVADMSLLSSRYRHVDDAMVMADVDDCTVCAHARTASNSSGEHGRGALLRSATPMTVCVATPRRCMPSSTPTSVAVLGEAEQPRRITTL